MCIRDRRCRGGDGVLTLILAGASRDGAACGLHHCKTLAVLGRALYIQYLIERYLPRGVYQCVALSLIHISDKNLLIICLAQAFLIHQQLLIQLFAGAKACELDFDIAVRDEARQLDEVFSQIRCV